MPPKTLGLCLSHPVGVTLKTSIWKQGLHLPKQVTEQQGQFGQVSPENERHRRLSVVGPEIHIGIQAIIGISPKCQRHFYA